MVMKKFGVRLQMASSEVLAEVDEALDRAPLSNSREALLEAVRVLSKTSSSQAEINLCDAFPKVAELPKLEQLAPPIFKVLEVAYSYRDKKQKKDIPRNQRLTTVIDKIVSAGGLEGAYEAYEHAANLASPLYRYDHEGSERRVRLEDGGYKLVKLSCKIEIPDLPIFTLPFCNPDFRKVIFAACRYHGIHQKQLEDQEKLVDLLIDLGFSDADHSDYVSSFITLITGRHYKRGEPDEPGYRHARRDRIYHK